MKQVTDLTIDTEERLKGVIDLVFEKAIDEPSFSVAYANMCRCLATVRTAQWIQSLNHSAYLLSQRRIILTSDVVEKKQL